MLTPEKTMKKCSQCEKEYPATNKYFHKTSKRDTLRSICKTCHKENCNALYNSKEGKAKRAEYNRKNRQKILKKKKEYRKNNKEAIAAYKKYYHNKRYHEDINYKLLHNCGNRVRKLLKDKDDTRTVDLLGCSIQELKQHLEKQFQEGMSWDNYGVKGWHIDHIKPCASFDLRLESEQKLCFHYTNLQPLWAIDNLRKSDKW